MGEMRRKGAEGDIVNAIYYEVEVSMTVDDDRTI
jgi:hypothetical protein